LAGMGVAEVIKTNILAIGVAETVFGVF